MLFSLERQGKRGLESREVTTQGEGHWEPPRPCQPPWSRPAPRAAAREAERCSTAGAGPPPMKAAGGDVREERNRRERERTGQRSTEEDRERGEKRGGEEKEEEKGANKKGIDIERQKHGRRDKERER